MYENLITVPRSVHHFVHFKVNLQKPLPQRVTKTLRNFKNTESAAFSQTLTDHLNLAPETGNADELYHWYNATITNCLEEHAPSETRTRTVKNRQPWYNETVHSARRKRHRAERKWRHSQCETDSADFETARNKVCTSILEAKQQYYANKLANANTKMVFQTVNSLLNNQEKNLCLLTMTSKIRGTSLLSSSRIKFPKSTKNLKQILQKLIMPLTLLIVALSTVNLLPNFSK